MVTHFDTFFCNFVCHKMKLSLGFLIMEHYYSTQYGVSVGGQLILGPGASLWTPFGLCPFICFILCCVLAASFG